MSEKETRFTPGPWFAKPDFSIDDGAQGIWIENGDQNVAFVPGYIDHPRNIADAAILAAAPDLYEALQKLNDAFYVDSNTGEWRLPEDFDTSFIDVALSKAIGETP